MRPVSTIVAVGLLAIAVAGCGGPGAKSAADDVGPKAGSLAPDFTARDIEGRTFRLSDHLGKKVIVLDFWSTYCQPCIAAFPHLNAMSAEHKDKGLLVLGVAIDGPESLAEVPAFARRNNVKFPVVTDEDSRIASLYNPRKTAPLQVLIDAKGAIVQVREGYNPGDEVYLEQEVKKLLAK